MKDHKHYDLAYRAHVNTSFSPDKRTNSACLGFDAAIEELQKLGVPQAKIDKYESLWVKHMQARGRCLSSMITGPANFPVARAEKANNAERRASEACMDYYSKLVAYAKKEKYYAENPDARPVMAGDSDAIERLQKKLLAHRNAHTKMLSVNALLRKKPVDEIALAVMLGEKAAKEIMQPDCMGNVGFASYALSNNRAEIKRLEGRIKQLKNAKAAPDSEVTINGVRVVYNTDDMRIELHFDGKPSDAMRAILKSAAFKWAPSKGVWQRQLTYNARYAFKQIVKPELEKMEAM